MAKNVYIQWGREVLGAEAEAVAAAASKLGADFEKAVSFVVKCRGKVVITGIGKSGHVGRKIAATMSSLGTPAVFMHSTEAMHGDAGMVSSGDVLIAISNSGTTREVLLATERCKPMCAAVIAMTGKPQSGLAQLAGAVLDISVSREADHLDLAPTSSSTVTLAVGDALAVAVSRAKKFTAADFAKRHGGGALGKKATENIK